MSASFQGPKTMQASWAARATSRTALHAPVAVEQADGAAASDGVTTRSQPKVTLYEPTGTRASRTRLAVEPVTTDGAVVAARDERLLARERDVLRRRAGVEDPWRAALASVDRDPALVARRDPDATPVGREHDVVREERRCERADEPRTPWIARVEHGDARRLRPERRPQRSAVRADRDVPRRTRDPRPPEHPRALDVEDDDLLARRVGDVREREAWMHRGVARCFEAVELGATPFVGGVEQRDDSVLGVRHDGDPVVHRLDAPRSRARADAADHATRLEVEHDDVALEIRGDERDRSAARRRRAPAGRARARTGRPRLPAGTRVCSHLYYAR